MSSNFGGHLNCMGSTPVGGTLSMAPEASQLYEGFIVRASMAIASACLMMPSLITTISFLPS